MGGVWALLKPYVLEALLYMEDTALGRLLYVKYGFGIRRPEIYQNSAAV